ncbi:uncharacterized protein LOC130709976 [Lotus japonicus]|uniref:uncharacterized protein LOC130709976 n=1 Tax=Lotus japonicus TaxID=34305 RepID=UPI0025910907|nr:uncharacterized protein LOC130709976 [Lotus japonicus]
MYSKDTTKPRSLGTEPRVHHAGRTMENRRKRDEEVNGGKRSYAQVVSGVGGSEQSDSSLGDALKETPVEVWYGPPVPQAEAWLERSMVGIIRNLDLIPSLQDAFILEGFKTIHVRYMGDDLALITGPRDMNLEETLDVSKEWLNDIFEVVYTWSPSVAHDHRVTWLRCSGLPLHMWTKECLAHLVSPVGTLMAVDGATLSFSRLDYARVLVRTSKLETIVVYKKVNANGGTYTIRINEEMNADISHCCNGPGSVNDSDDFPSVWSGSEDKNDEESVFSETPDEGRGRDDDRFIATSGV